MAENPFAKFAEPAADENPFAKFKDGMSWADVPGEALRNAPGSAVNLAHQIVQPVLHPIETGQAIANVGYGLASKAAGALGVKQEPDEKAADEAGVNAIGQFIKDRYGSFDALKKTLATDPVGSAADAAMVLTGGGGLAARAPGVTGRVGQVVRSTGNAIDPVAGAVGAIGATGRAVGNTASGVLGLTTGAGATPIRGAYAAGRAGNPIFAEHMRGARPIEDVVEMAEKGVSAMTQDRGKAYRAGTAELRTDKLVDFAPIDRAIREAGESLHHKGIVKDKRAAAAHTEMVKTLDDFKALAPAERTAEALDAMKQAIQGIRESIPFESKNARRVVGEVHAAIGAEIRRQVPSYAAAMKGYADASDQISQINRTLSVNGKAATDTTLRKLQSVMRNNVNTSYGYRVKLAEELGKKQPNLMPALAGQALNNMMPRGLAGSAAGLGGVYGAAVNPVALAMLPMASPRLIGEAAYGLGRGAKVVNDIGSAHGSNAVMRALALGYQGGNLARQLQPVRDLMGDVYPPGDPRNMY